MKAIVYSEFGDADVLRLQEIEKPVPKDNEVLIQVRAAALNHLDRHMMHRAPLFVRRIMKMAEPTEQQPSRIGRDVAGVVEAVGSAVTTFKPGDAVFGL